MNSKRLFLVLLMALTSGGLASYLSMARMARPAEAAPAPAPSMAVMVTARPLVPGTMIQATDLKQVPWPGDTPPSGLFTREEEVVGRVLTVALQPDEPILASLLAEEGSASGLPGLIPDGMRAISVSVDEVVGVNGFVGPGARVDVIATMEVDVGTGSEAISRVVLQDVEVLASGHQLQADPNGTPQQANVATLLVSPGDAEELVLATHRGRVQLVLRGNRDRTEVATPGVRTSAMMGTAKAPAPAVRPARHEPVREPRRNPRIRIVATDGSGRTLAKY